MSHRATVGLTQTAGRGSRLNVSKKPVVSGPAAVRGGVGKTSNRTGNSTSHRVETVAGNHSNSSHSQGVKSSSASSVNPSKSSLRNSSLKSTPKPRVVTLADLNLGDLNSKPNSKNQKSDAASKQKPGPVKNCKKSDTKPGNKSKMWDGNPPPSYNTSSTSQRGNRNVAGGNHGNSISGSPGSSLTNDNVQGSPGQAGDSERRATYQPQGGYTLIPPDPRKRDKLQSQRTSELARLDAYKNKTKPGHVSIKPSRIGGSKQSEEETRRQQERELKNKKYQQIAKRQQWAEEKKQTEEAEFAEKKARARQQTERNKQRDEERQAELQAERRQWIAQGGLARLQDGGDSGTYEDEDYDVDEDNVDALVEMFPHKSRKK